MEKIPTIFERTEDRRHVIDRVTSGCEWVLAGEGVATRKFDGTCVLIKPNRTIWTRREVKPGKEPPPFFDKIETDPVTGKTVGWEPASQSGFDKFIAEAIAGTEDDPKWAPGTYELIGPKINGNPEQQDRHMLTRHGEWRIHEGIPTRDFDGLRAALMARTWEGIVFHHPDGRMAKIKKRDFPKSDLSLPG